MVQAGTKLSERHANGLGSIASVSPARWQDERRVALTERFAKSAETGGRKSPTFYDDEVISFGLQVRENGRNTFTLHYPYTSASTAFCHSRTLS